MTDVVPYTARPPQRIARADRLEETAELANRIAGTDFVPSGLRGNSAAITAAILYGDEVGLGPMQSLAKIAVINGRPTLAAEAQRALILAAGHSIWIEETNTTRCIVAGRRRDADEVSRITWTMDDAKRAGLAQKGPWRAYPRQMLLARASAELARAVFPDAIGGLAATEELDDDPNVAALGNGDEAVAGAPSRPATRRRRASVTASPDPDPPAGRDEATVAEVEPPEPVSMNDAQRRRMMAAFRERGITDRAERLTWAANIIGRDIESANDLTAFEASQIIEALSDLTVGSVVETAGTEAPVAPSEDEPASAFQIPASVGQLPPDEQAVLDELSEVATEIPPGSSL